MKFFLFPIILLSSFCLLGQGNTIKDSILDPEKQVISHKVKSIQTNDVLNLNYSKIKKYELYQSQLEDPSINWRKPEKHKEVLEYVQNFNTESYLYNDAKDVINYLYDLEENNFDRNDLLVETDSVLLLFTKLDVLSLLYSIVRGQSFVHSAHKQLVQKKLMTTIALQMQTQAYFSLPLYNYPTIKKKGFKGIQIEHANDLLAFGIFEPNNDMDYTGGLKVSILTDLLKLDLFKPTQSYQAITYGAEVYTPYFKDTAIFTTDTSFNILDRPHGSFQFFGIENHAISKNHRMRWSTNLRVGIIGSRFGHNFQYYLHRDLSISPAPIGWDAQIGFPGRLAIQGDFRIENILYTQPYSIFRRNYKIVLSSIIGGGTGHFMSYGDAGLNVSTHNFKEKNQINTISKSFQTKKSKVIRKVVPYTNINLIFRGVAHNAMLGGFGLFTSKEKSPQAFAEPSKYILEKERIRPLVIFSNFTFGIQLSNFNLFYKYSVKSPEYKSDGMIKTYNEGKEIKIDPNTNWHHYASIGLSYTI